MSAPARTAPSTGKSLRTSFENFQQRQKYNPSKVLAIPPPAPGGLRGAAGLATKMIRRALDPNIGKTMQRKRAVDANKAIGKDKRTGKPMGTPSDYNMTKMRYKTMVKATAAKKNLGERAWETAQDAIDAVTRRTGLGTGTRARSTAGGIVGVGSSTAKAVRDNSQSGRRGGGGGGRGW